MLRLQRRYPLPFTLYDPITPLPSIYAIRAREELNEIVTEVPSQLERFRLSISSLSHITCPTDDIFLLAFLRFEKYDHANALSRLENFCAFRSLPEKGKPDWFQYESLDKDLWRRIGELRLNFGVVTFHEVMCASQIWNDVMLLDPRVQIAGFIFLMDMSNMQLRELQQMSDQNVSELSCKYFQEALPLRANKMIYFNLPDQFEPFYKISNEWLSDDSKKQVMVLKEGLQQAYDAVAGLQDVMPKEYGGQNATTDEIYEKNAHLMNGIWSNPPELLVHVDETKRTQSTVFNKVADDDMLNAVDILPKQQFYSTD